MEHFISAYGMQTQLALSNSSFGGALQQMVGFSKSFQNHGRVVLPRDVQHPLSQQ